jgi:S-adenosylmethionine synthetase
LTLVNQFVSAFGFDNRKTSTGGLCSMFESIAVRELPRALHSAEIVERKGIGHPDTICDALAENFSRNLCRWYVENAGMVLHHNVDKALLRGGTARAEFGAGEVIEPIDIYLAGRAVTSVGGKTVPLDDLAIEGSRTWLKQHLHALDPIKDVRIHCLVRPGSADLIDLFKRGGETQTPKANDTSFGVGYAPKSPLEAAVLDAGRLLDGPVGRPKRPARGEDTKIMAVRGGGKVETTVACAIIARHVPDMAAYRKECLDVAGDVQSVFEGHGFADARVLVNAADDPEQDSYYLTVTGTSAEAGDDGQVGRGNRANGLITPNRVMSLEAVCGKNPRSHVGKLYNVAAQQIADRIVNECKLVEAAQCCLVSRIGQPITQPSMVDIAITMIDGGPVSEQGYAVQEIAGDVLSGIPSMLDGFINGEIQLY